MESALSQGDRAGLAGTIIATRRHSLAYRLKKGLPWYLCIAPNLLAFLVFNLLSWLFLIYLSLNDWNLLGAKEFVGLENYTRMVSDQVLHKALLNTLQYIVMFVPTMAAISLGLASLVNTRLPGMYGFRALIYLPVVTSIAVIALIWRYILIPRPDGILNYFLAYVGIAPQEWLLNLHLALPSITMMQIWSMMGYYMVLWLAGLQSVPEELYEAARIDGAGRWALFRYVTLPVLRPTTIFIILISTIGAFQMFGPPYMLTGGGPMYATTSMVYYIWQTAFGRYQVGYASAASMLLFVLILIASLIQRKYMGWSESLY